MEKFIAEEEFLLHFWHCPKALNKAMRMFLVLQILDQ